MKRTFKFTGRSTENAIGKGDAAADRAIPGFKTHAGSHTALVWSELQVDADADWLFSLLSDPAQHGKLFGTRKEVKYWLVERVGPRCKYKVDTWVNWMPWSCQSTCKIQVLMETDADKGTVSFCLREPGFLRVYEGTWHICPVGQPALNLHARQMQQHQQTQQLRAVATEPKGAVSRSTHVTQPADHISSDCFSAKSLYATFMGDDTTFVPACVISPTHAFTTGGMPACITHPLVMMNQSNPGAILISTTSLQADNTLGPEGAALILPVRMLDVSIHEHPFLEDTTPFTQMGDITHVTHGQCDVTPNAKPDMAPTLTPDVTPGSKTMILHEVRMEPRCPLLRLFGGMQTKLNQKQVHRMFKRLAEVTLEHQKQSPTNPALVES